MHYCTCQRKWHLEAAWPCRCSLSESESTIKQLSPGCSERYYTFCRERQVSKMGKEVFWHFSENSLEGKFLKLYPGGGQMRAMFLSHPSYFATWQCPCLFFLIFMLSPSLTYAENTGELSSRSTPLTFTCKQDYSPGLFTLKLLQTGMALLPLMLG